MKLEIESMDHDATMHSKGAYCWLLFVFFLNSIVNWPLHISNGNRLLRNHQPKNNDKLWVLTWIKNTILLLLLWRFFSRLSCWNKTHDLLGYLFAQIAKKKLQFCAIIGHSPFVNNSIHCVANVMEGKKRSMCCQSIIFTVSELNVS